MNIQETGGFDWSSFVGTIFDKVSSERQADRSAKLEMAKINALNTTAGALRAYTEGQTSNSGTSGASMNAMLPWTLGIAAIGIGLFLALK